MELESTKAMMNTWHELTGIFEAPNSEFFMILNFSLLLPTLLRLFGIGRFVNRGQKRILFVLTFQSNGALPAYFSVVNPNIKTGYFYLKSTYLHPEKMQYAPIGTWSCLK